jgi:hypothetical protein
MAKFWIYFTVICVVLILGVGAYVLWSKDKMRQELGQENLEAMSDLSTFVNITSSNRAGGGIQGWNHNVFYGKNNGRWYVLGIENSSDVVISSSGDNGSTWDFGAELFEDTNSYTVPSASCVYTQFNSTYEYLDCSVASGATNEIRYKRINLTNSGTFVQAPSSGTYETPFSSADSLDDTASPRITRDSNVCLLILFDLEDDSVDTVLEHKVTLIKEKQNDTTTCDDGDWDTNDTETGFPIQASSNGFNADAPLDIITYGDLDAQLYWMNTTTTTAQVLFTAFFNGTSNAVDVARVMHNDVEISAYTILLPNYTTLTFMQNDTLFTVEGIRMDGKNGTMKQFQFNNLVNDSAPFQGGRVAGFYDNVSIDSSSHIFYANSTVNGIHLRNVTDTNTTPVTLNGTLFSSVTTLFAGGTIAPISVYYEPTICRAMVNYFYGNSTKMNQFTESIVTDSCGEQEQAGTLNITYLTPTGNTNVTENAFFNFSVNVSCEDGDCGNVSAYLDPMNFFRDDFDRADGYLGSNWTNATTLQLAIQNGRAGLNESTTGSFIQFYNQNNFSEDVYVEVQYVNSSFITVWNGTGFILRQLTPVATNRYNALLYPTGTPYSCAIAYDGVVSSEEFYGAFVDCEQPAINETWRFVKVGSNLTLYRNGTFTTSLINTNITTAGQGGIVGRIVGTPVLELFEYFEFGNVYKEGLVSTIVGDKPFYTTNLNPQNTACLQSMINNSYCVISWQVNATGSTVGAIPHTFFAFANSSNTTSTGTGSSFNITIISAVVGDSCTYTSGNWDIDCSDFCNISSNTDLGGNNISITGTGITRITGNITNWVKAFIQGTDSSNICTVRNYNGGGLKE